MSPTERIATLLGELEKQRAAFLGALDALGPRAEGRRIVETWDGRDLTVHCAFWSEHGANAIELAVGGRGGEFDYDTSQTDEMNARTAEAGRRTPLPRAREREAAAYERFHASLADLDEAMLDQQLGNGDTVEDVVRYDGADHYAEHAAHLRTVLG